MNYILSLLLILVIGCSTTPDKIDKEKSLHIDLADIYMGSGVERYFLTSLPAWANYSTSASCLRTVNKNYFNMETLRGSYALNYAQSIQFQYMYNRESKNIKESSNQIIPFKDKEQLFYSVSDRIQSGITHFSPPTFNKVNVIWVDKYLNGKRPIEELRTIVQSDKFSKGYPVFVSLCHDYENTQKFITKNKLQENIKIISFEFLTPYSKKGNRIYYSGLEISELFKKDQELNIYISNDEVVPFEITGKYNVIKY
jgi:hypothetical protein